MRDTAVAVAAASLPAVLLVAGKADVASAWGRQDCRTRWVEQVTKLQETFRDKLWIDPQVRFVNSTTADVSLQKHLGRVRRSRFGERRARVSRLVMEMNTILRYITYVFRHVFGSGPMRTKQVTMDRVGSKWVCWFYHEGCSGLST